MGIPDHFNQPPKKAVCMKRSNRHETRHETRTGSKLGKKYIKAAYFHPTYLTYMKSASYKMLGWMTHKLEPRLIGEISTMSKMQMIPL